MRLLGLPCHLPFLLILALIPKLTLSEIKLLSPHEWDPRWVDESSGEEILYVDTKKDAEEIIQKHNLDARIILCTSDGRGDVNHLFNSYV